MAASACDPPSLEEEALDTDTCHICYDDVAKSNMKWLECAHSLCTVCYVKLEKRECPFCRRAIPKPERPRKPPLRPASPNQDPIIFEFDELDVRSPPRPRQRHRRHEMNARRHSVDVVVRIPMFLDDVAHEEDVPEVRNRERRMTRISHKMIIYSKRPKGSQSY